MRKGYIQKTFWFNSWCDSVCCSIPSLSEDVAREAFKSYASSQCCYSSGPAQDGVITSMEPFNTYRVIWCLHSLWCVCYLRMLLSCSVGLVSADLIQTRLITKTQSWSVSRYVVRIMTTDHWLFYLQIGSHNGPCILMLISIYRRQFIIFFLYLRIRVQQLNTPFTYVTNLKAIQVQQDSDSKEVFELQAQGYELVFFKPTMKFRIQKLHLVYIES